MRKMSLNEIEKQLKHMEKQLNKPFPYKDTKRIQKDFIEDFSRLSDDEDWLTADFNTYCMNIAGTLSYVLRGKSKKIPKAQIDLLKFSFLELFNQYKFLEAKMSQYNEFHQEYINFEYARKLLLQYLSSNND